MIQISDSLAIPLWNVLFIASFGAIIASMSSVAHFLLGQTRTAVLSELLLHPEASLHVRALARLAGASPGSLHRDLRAMTALGLLSRQEVGRQVHYRANTQSPVFEELAGLLRKTAGLVESSVTH